MTGPVVPDDNNIARYCKPITIDDEGKVTYAAFLLRKNADDTPKEAFLSAFWLERFGRGSPSDALVDLRKACPTEAGLKLAVSGRFALLHVGNTRENVRKRTTDSRNLRVTHEEPPHFHAGLFDTIPDEDNIAAAILESVSGFAPTV